MQANPTDTFDLIFSINFYITGTVSIILNIAMLWLVKYKSPEIIKEYRLFMANLAVTDILLTLLGTSLQNRQITRGRVISGLPLGPAKHLGSKYAGPLHSDANRTNLRNSYVPLLFLMRYILVCKPHLKYFFCKRNAALLISTVVAYCLLYFTATCLSAVPKETLVEKLNQSDPYIEFSSVVLFGTDTSMNRFGRLSLIMSTGSNIVAYIIVLCCANRIVVSFNKNRNLMQAYTRHCHLSLIRALFIQATFPLICIFPGFINMLVTIIFGKTFLIWDYLGFALLSWISVLDPLVTMLSVRPYRRAVFFWLSTSETSVQPSRIMEGRSRAASFAMPFSPGVQDGYPGYPRRSVHSAASIRVGPRQISNLSPAYSIRNSVLKDKTCHA